MDNRNHQRIARSLLCGILVCAAAAHAQMPASTPPAAVRLEEKPLAALSAADTNPYGVQALALNPARWKHAETPHFILHYRRATEAQKVAREVEFTLWYVAQSLGAVPAQYKKRSHVYVFQDIREWSDFRDAVKMAEWTGSFAAGDDLFLHVGGAGEGFDSRILAHETTHAVVARLYPGSRWPRWLNEGFAETMAGASMAARKRVWAKGMEQQLENATLPPDEVTAITEYPQNPKEVTRFYQSSERLVRYLLNNQPKDRFPRFIDAVCEGLPFREAYLKVYGDQVKDYETFLKRYAQAR